jgi:hypothetical protein
LALKNTLKTTFEKTGCDLASVKKKESLKIRAFEFAP